MFQESLIPAGHARIQRRLWLQRDHHRPPGRRDGESRRRIAASARAIKHNPIEILKECVIHEAIKIRIDGGIAIPCIAIANQRQRGPACGLVRPKAIGN